MNPPCFFAFVITKKSLPTKNAIESEIETKNNLWKCFALEIKRLGAKESDLIYVCRNQIFARVHKGQIKNRTPCFDIRFRSLCRKDFRPEGIAWTVFQFLCIVSLSFALFSRAMLIIAKHEFLSSSKLQKRERDTINALSLSISLGSNKSNASVTVVCSRSRWARFVFDIPILIRWT